MSDLLLSPPAAFAVILAFVILLNLLLGVLAFRRPRGVKAHADLSKPYACGEDDQQPLIQPDYSQFFPFAFFFTILHIVALVVTTALVDGPGSFVLILFYLAAVVASFFIFFKGVKE
jgi:NADH-quinone oxidoreductase subunit A